MKKLFKYYRAFHEYGFWENLTVLKKRIIKKTRKIYRYEKYIIFGKELKRDKDYFIHSDLCFFREGNNQDIDKIIYQYGEHYDSNGPRVLNERLSNGEILLLGFLADSKDTICFLSWLSLNDLCLQYIKKTSGIRDVVFLKGIFVNPDMRNSGIGKSGISFAEKIAVDSGWEQIWAIVHEKNESSKRMFLGRDWPKKGLARKWVVFGKEIYRSKVFSADYI